MHDATNHPFWSYSLQQYSHPSCETFCLKAQTELQADVNILLFCVWLGTQHKEMDLELIHASHVNKVQEAIIQPLRHCRQHLKQRALIDNDVKVMREQIKQLELGAEQLEQSMLYQLSQTIEAGTEEKRSVTRKNLRTYLVFLKVRKEGLNAWIQAAERHLYPKS